METETIINNDIILKKKYNKRNSPKGLTTNEKQQFYMSSFPEYREYNYNFQKTKSLCVCGCLVSNRNMSVHRQSYKHDVLMLQLDNINKHTSSPLSV